MLTVKQYGEINYRNTKNPLLQRVDIYRLNKQKYLCGGGTDLSCDHRSLAMILYY